MSDMAQHLLYKDAIAVVRARLKPFNLHSMDRGCILNPVTCIVILGTFGSIKVRIVIRRQFHPTDRRLIRQPHNRHFVRPQILQIWAMHQLDL